MFAWDDIRHFLAVAECGSTLAAGKRLGVNASTVQRRIDELERRLGQALVRRLASGYRLTEFGEALLPAAQSLAGAADALMRQVAAYGSQLEGTIRLTCPEPLVARLSGSDFVEAFHARYPATRIEFVMSDRYLDLSRGEADVALRSGEPEDEALVGRKIADSVWAVYASRGYVQAHGRPMCAEDIADHAIIGFDGMLAGHRAARWLAAVAPAGRIAARNTSVLGVLQSVRAGAGLAPLPTTIAGMHDDLVQVLPPVAELSRGWYLLAHPDLRNTPRTGALFDFALDNLDLLRPILMG